jgi:hypothetical protein
MSAAPADIQAIMKKVMSGQAPTPDEAKRFNDYVNAGGGAVVTRSITSYGDSVRSRALGAISASAMPSTVSATLSGAYIAALPVTIAAVFDSTKNLSAVSFTSQAMISQLGPVLSVAIAVAGRLHTGTYTSPPAGVPSGGRVSPSRSQTWAVTRGSGNDMGSYTLAITSVSVVETGAGGIVYTVHGTLTATLVSGLGPSVMLAVSF